MTVKEYEQKQNKERLYNIKKEMAAKKILNETLNKSSYANFLYNFTTITVIATVLISILAAIYFFVVSDSKIILLLSVALLSQILSMFTCILCIDEVKKHIDKNISMELFEKIIGLIKSRILYGMPGLMITCILAMCSI